MQASPRWPWYARALALCVALGSLTSYVALSGCTRSARKPPPYLPATKAAPMHLDPPPAAPQPAPAPAPPDVGNATKNRLLLPTTKSAPMHLVPQQQAPR